MKWISLILINFFFSQELSAQYANNSWLNQEKCSKKLFNEFKLIDTTLYYFGEEENKQYNQSFFGEFSRSFIKDYYSGTYFFKCDNEIINDINCILDQNPKNINPRTIYVITFFLFEINDERYITFMENVLDNLEKGNFNCFDKFDCNSLFNIVFIPSDGFEEIKYDHLQKNYKKDSFKRLLTKIYNSKMLDESTKKEIREEIAILENRKR